MKLTAVFDGVGDAVSSVLVGSGDGVATSVLTEAMASVGTAVASFAAAGVGVMTMTMGSGASHPLIITVTIVSTIDSVVRRLSFLIMPACYHSGVNVPTDCFLLLAYGIWLSC